MTNSFDTDIGGVDWSRHMIGKSPRFMAALELISKFAECDAPVLIEGETGTGKELAARAIYEGSQRRTGPFIPVNCGAIPESLIENELFGHARGAYTDAGTPGQGLLRLANEGTLFLDEIDALPLRGQVALLRFLQDGHYRPLSAQKEEVVDVRVIVASNSKLDTLVEERSFRADLLFRLRVLSFEMPALRERPGDPLLLADFFLTKFAEHYGSCGTRRRLLDSDAHAWFNSYLWPGNVRELESLVHRGFLLAEGPEIRIPEPVAQVAAPPNDGLVRGNLAAVPQPYAVARMQALELFDQQYLTDLLLRTQGNVSRAARLAGKERRALGKLLTKNHIDPVHFRH